VTFSAPTGSPGRELLLTIHAGRETWDLTRSTISTHDPGMGGPQITIRILLAGLARIDFKHGLTGTSCFQAALEPKRKNTSPPDGGCVGQPPSVPRREPQVLVAPQLLRPRQRLVAAMKVNKPIMYLSGPVCRGAPGYWQVFIPAR